VSDTIHTPDVSDALLALLDKQLAANQAQATALASVATELVGVRAELTRGADVVDAVRRVEAILPGVERALADLADVRASVQAAHDEAIRARAYAAGHADADAAHAAAVGGAIRGSVVAWVGSPAGRMWLGAILALLLGAAATMILPYVDFAALRDLAAVP
jgi:hypothetical protein